MSTTTTPDSPQIREQEDLPHVVVLGGGFGGMEVCKTLAHEKCRVTLIDQKNHHLFQPLLYQVATGGLSAPDIAAPLRRVFEKAKNLTVCKETVMGVDLDEKKVVTDQRTLTYDYLILGLGVKTSYFGNDHWAEHTLELKSLSQALEIRRCVLDAFERAELASDPEEMERLMTIAIVGGGPTGVELAGAFAELKEHVFKGNFRIIDPMKARIVLFEAGDRLLGAYHEKQSAYTKRVLERKGVEVRLGVKVEDIGKGYLKYGDERLEAENIVWAAGMEAPRLTREMKVEKDRAGRILTNPDLTVPEYPDAFVIGDLAKVMDEKGDPVPGVAPAAMQMGSYVAKTIRAYIRNQEPGEKPFRYNNKGDMATIGRSSAIANIKGWKTNGFVAWVLWLMIHLMFLVGFRNRIAVFINWAYAYLTFDRGARIIIEDGRAQSQEGEREELQGAA